MKFKKTLLATALVVFGGVAMSASAAISTNTFTVSLKVNSTCKVNVSAASNITLGPVDAGVAPTIQSGTFSVNCSNKTPFYVGLAPKGTSTTGAGLLAGFTTPANTIAYQLYQDSAGATVWGNTATTTSAGNGESGTGAGMAAGKAVSFTAYANATGSTDVAPDTYSDIVTINVNF